jgi:DNA-directed RNA polymerase specialized sigma24 family protein
VRTAPTAEAFNRLLDRLDADRSRAGLRYEDLRRTLVRFFQWRGAPFPDEHADDTFDRVARRLEEGVVVANIGGYCYEVARLVALEALKKPEAKRAGTAPALAAGAEAARAPEEAAVTEARLACLEHCLGALPPEQRAFILEYYRDDRRRRIDRRRLLAERLGLRREALANRAQRLRDRLEECMRGCLGRKSAT